MPTLATFVSLHLKYCERCGGLWLRPEGTATPYCPACEQSLAALPARSPRPERKIVPATRVLAAPALLSTAAYLGRFVRAGVI